MASKQKSLSPHHSLKSNTDTETHTEREKEREREKKERIRRGGRGRRRKMKRTEPQNKLREEGSTPNKTNQKNIIKKLKHFAPDIK